MKLMIVDDHAQTRGLIRETIGPFVAEICECTSGMEAVARCAGFKPDLVTMDLQMQPMDGLQATRLLLALHPAACVVIVTQSDLAMLRLSAAQAGAQHFIQKDDFAELRRHAEQQMHRHAAARGLRIVTRPSPPNRKIK